MNKNEAKVKLKTAQSKPKKKRSTRTGSDFLPSQWEYVRREEPIVPHKIEFFPTLEPIREESKPKPKKEEIKKEEKPKAFGEIPKLPTKLF